MRIVSLLPSATEIVAALGLGDHLVAVSHECDHPPALVDGRPRITSGMDLEGYDPAAIDAAVVDAVEAGDALYRIDGDRLVELAPDLIITQGICDVCAIDDAEVGRTLRMLPDVLPGVATITLSGNTWEGILDDIVAVGAATDRAGHATAIVELLGNRWNAIEPISPRRRVLVLEWPEPMFSAGHWVPQQVEVAGGIEVIGRPGERSRRIAFDEIENLRADVVVMAACGYGAVANRGFAEALPIDFHDAELWAVDANSYFSRPGPRIVDGAEILRSILGGEPVADTAAERIA